jgi:hypothetical protein
MARRGRDVLVIGLICTLAVAFWQWRIIGPAPLPQKVSGQNQDLFCIYYPAFTFAYRSEEFLPRWNPYQLAGTPFLANYNGGFLYAVNFLSAVLPVHRAMGYASMAHIALAGLFVFIAARAMALSHTAALLGAIAFMFNLYFLTERIRPSYLAGLTWIPLVFLCAGRLVVRPGWWSAVFLGIAVTLQFLTGHAQIVCYTTYCLLVIAPVYLLCRREWSAEYLRRLMAAVAVAGVTAVLLSAIQLLPTLELVGQATRGFHGLTFEQTQPWVVDAQRVRRVIFSSGLAVAMALLALTDRGRLRLVLPAATLIVFTALVALWVPFYRDFFYFLPGVDLFRGRQEILVIGALGLAILAGIGVDRILSARLGWERFGLVATVVILLVALRAVPPNPAIPAWYMTAVLVGIAVALLVERPRVRLLIVWAVVGLVAAERFSNVESNKIMLPQHNTEEFFSPPPFVRFLRERLGADRILVFRDWKDRFPITEKMGTLYRVSVVQDYEPLAPAAYHEFLRPLEGANIDAPLFWGRFYPHPARPEWRLLDMLATRYIVVPPGLSSRPAPGPSFRLVYDAPDARVFENTKAMQRAYLSTRHEVVPDAEAMLATIHAPRFNPRALTLVDREVTWPPATEVAPVPERVRFLEFTAEYVTLEVSTPQPALVILADLYWPGWRVSVDGVEGEVYRVNYLFRGVAVGPGLHTVRFWYDPLSLKAGAVMTAGTATLLLVAGAVQLGRRSRWGARQPGIV